MVKLQRSELHVYRYRNYMHQLIIVIDIHIDIEGVTTTLCMQLLSYAHTQHLNLELPWPLLSIFKFMEKEQENSSCSHMKFYTNMSYFCINQIAT